MVSKKHKELIEKTLLNARIVNGEWDDTLLVWKYKSRSYDMVILDYLHNTLDPNRKLHRVITQRNIYKLYKIVDSVTNKVKAISNNLYEHKGMVFNYIEMYVLAIGFYTKIYSLQCVQNGVYTKSKQIEYSNVLCLSETRTSDDICHMFVDYEITQSDIDNYDADAIDLFILELLDGNMYNYDHFMNIFVCLHSARYSRPEHFVIRCSDNTRNMLFNLFTLLYKRFIRENNYSQFKSRLSLQCIDTYYQTCKLLYSHNCLILGQKKYVDTIKWEYSSRKDKIIADARDMEVKEFPHSSIVKIILNAATGLKN